LGEEVSFKYSIIGEESSPKYSTAKNSLIDEEFHPNN
jgi:hypothetical protein